jgi:hypothetical protein
VTDVFWWERTLIPDRLPGSNQEQSVMVHLHPLARLHLQHGAEHLHSLGARATAELLAEVAAKIGSLPCILATLDEYQHRLTPEMLRLSGGDRFPRRPLRVVPR